MTNFHRKAFGNRFTHGPQHQIALPSLLTQALTQCIAHLETKGKWTNSHHFLINRGLFGFLPSNFFEFRKYTNTFLISRIVYIFSYYLKIIIVHILIKLTSSNNYQNIKNSHKSSTKILITEILSVFSLFIFCNFYFLFFYLFYHQNFFGHVNLTRVIMTLTMG